MKSTFAVQPDPCSMPDNTEATDMVLDETYEDKEKLIVNEAQKYAAERAGSEDNEKRMMAEAEEYAKKRSSSVSEVS